MKGIYLLILLSLSLLLFSLDDIAQNNKTTTRTKREIVVGVGLYDNSDNFISEIKKGIEDYKNILNNRGILDKDESLHTFGPSITVRAIYADAERQSDTQINQVEIFITQKVDAIAINMVDVSQAKTVIEKVKQANIPIIFFNRQPPIADLNSWDKVYYVGSQPEQSGEIQASLMQDYWVNNKVIADKNKDGKLQYIILRGDEIGTDAEMRTKSVKDYFAKNNIQTELLAETVANWQRVTAEEKMKELLTIYGEKIEAILANNDAMALGAIDALKDQGYFLDGKFMPVLGIDASYDAKEAIKFGRMMGTVVNDASMQGRSILAIAVSLALGEDPSKSKSINIPNLNGKMSLIPYTAYES